MNSIQVLDLAITVISILMLAGLSNFWKRNKLSILLSGLILFYGLVNLFWFIVDWINLPNPTYAYPAIIFGYISVFFGFLFVTEIIGKYKEYLQGFGVGILFTGLLAFLEFPIEYEFVDGVYSWYYSEALHFALIPLDCLSFALPILLLIYAIYEHKDIREMAKGLILSLGFGLIFLGTYVMIPHITTSLTISILTTLVGTIIIFVVFIVEERFKYKLNYIK